VGAEPTVTLYFWGGKGAAGRSRGEEQEGRRGEEDGWAHPAPTIPACM